MINENNIILMADSYKYSMHLQYPPKTRNVFSYIESSGGKYDYTVFFGLQYFIKKYLSKPITRQDINEAEEIITAHGEPFYREGWEYILNVYNGHLPICIKSVEEGSVVKTQNVLLYICALDNKCFWLVTFLETALLRAIWYPTTVATQSWEIKKLIKNFLEETGDISGLPFKLHDFGARGASSHETAAIGGLAHLINFQGTDTVESLIYGKNYYDIDMAGFSIPAAEHSTITSWGKENEIDAFKNMLNKFAKPGSIVAVVSDSYDIFNACNIWGSQLKQQIIDSGATIVIRPDSGDPVEVNLKCFEILESYFGSIINEKGYKVLNNVRLIQGDGVNYDTINLILTKFKENKISADNIAFGMGGALLQQVNRDTQRFAMKCCSIVIDDKNYDVYKDPITDSNKTSKKGLHVYVENIETKEKYSIPIDEYNNNMKKYNLLMDIRYFFVQSKFNISFDKIRENSNIE